MTLLFNMGPPMRPCGSHKRTELNRPASRATWAARKGGCWELHGILAYWKLCWKCQSCRWTHDKRKKNSVFPGVGPNFGTIAAAGHPRGSEQELGMARQSQPSHSLWTVDLAEPKACRVRPKLRMYVYGHVQNHQVFLVNVW